MSIPFIRHQSTPAPSWPRCCITLSIGLAWACSEASSDTPRETQPPTEVMSVRDNAPPNAVSLEPGDAGSEPYGAADTRASCTGLECSRCPAPPIELMSGSEPVWSRHPRTGECCRYEDRAVAPENWPWFYTEAECQSDCRCSVLDGYLAQSDVYVTERTSVECRCSKETCPTTISEAEERQCLRSGVVERHVGCGQVFVVDGGGLYGDGWLFEQSLQSNDAGTAVSRLIGAYQFTDAASWPCQTGGWVAGVEFECASAIACQVCGESFPTPLPPCE